VGITPTDGDGDGLGLGVLVGEEEAGAAVDKVTRCVVDSFWVVVECSVDVTGTAVEVMNFRVAPGRRKGTSVELTQRRGRGTQSKLSTVVMGHKEVDPNTSTVVNVVVFMHRASPCSSSPFLLQ